MESIGTARFDNGNDVLDALLKFARESDIANYLSCYSDSASRFLGTDAEENWTVAELHDMIVAERGGKMWSYTLMEGSERIFTESIIGTTEEEGEVMMIGFDEKIVNKDFGLCRGTGVLIKRHGYVTVQQYHLSIDVKNELAFDVVKLHKNRDFFYEKKHELYIMKKASDVSSFEYMVMQHLRMSGVYWAATASMLMGRAKLFDEFKINDWVMSCYDENTGGFRGNIGHDVHLLYTLSAVQLLAMSDSLDLVDSERVLSYVSSLQLEDGSFMGDKWGEVDTRFSYCAICLCRILNNVNAINMDKAIAYILTCRNFDGGFGAVPGAESHAGQIFTCVAALELAGGLHRLNSDEIDLLSWWLCERQCDSGGLNGRPEKQADVCYSWWILSCLTILKRVDWIDREKLVTFILKCQDQNGGGIADRPEDVPDIFHTYFGIAGLCLLGYFEGQKHMYTRFDNIDPAFALPVSTVKRFTTAKDS